MPDTYDPTKDPQFAGSFATAKNAAAPYDPTKDPQFKGMFGKPAVTIDSAKENYYQKKQPIGYDEAAALYDDGEKRGLVNSVKGGVGPTLDYAGTVGKAAAGAVGQVLGDTGNAAWEIAKNPLRALNPVTWTEAGGRGFYQFGDMVRRVYNKVGDEVKDTATGATREEKIQHYMDRLNSNLAYEAQQEHGLDGKGNMLPKAVTDVVEPNQVIAKGGANWIDPITLVTMGAGALPEGMVRAAAKGIATKAPALARAAEVAGKVMAVPGQIADATVGRAARALPGAVEKTAGALKTAAGAPERLIKKLPGPAQAPVALAGVTAATTTGVLPYYLGLKGAQGTLKGVEKAAEFTRRLMALPADRNLPRLVALGRDASAPEWIQSTAKTFHKYGLGTAGEVAGTAAHGAAHGAGMGAVLGALSTESPEELGGAIGSGAVLGAGGRVAGRYSPRGQRAVQEMKHALDAKDLFDHLEATGQPGDRIARLPGDAARAVANYRAMINPDLQVRLLDGAEYAVASPDAPNSGGFFDEVKGQRRLTVNVEASKGEAAGHELGHVLEKEAGALPEARAAIMDLLGPDGVMAERNSYARKLVEDNLKPGEVATPEQIAAMLDALDARHKGGEWIYKEIFADASKFAFRRDLVRDVLDPSLWRKLQLAYKDPMKVGDGAVPPGAIFDDPRIYGGDLRKTVYDSLKALYDDGQTQPKLKEDKEGLPGGHKLNPRQAASHPGVPESAKSIRGSDMAVKPTREVKREERARDREAKAEFVDRPATPAAPLAPDDIQQRTRLDGTVEHSGTRISNRLAGLKQFSTQAKQIAAQVESLISSAAGGVLRTWYFKPDNIEVQQIYISPYDFHVSQKGNVLVRGVGVTALQRKVAEWQNDPNSRLHKQWGGDTGAFLTDLDTYLQNHRADLPGDANGIGAEKKNALNFFVVGRHVALAAFNSWRATATPGDKSIIRELRLDRMANPEGAPGSFPVDWDKAAHNLSPGGQKAAPKGFTYAPEREYSPGRLERNDEVRAVVDGLAAGRPLYRGYVPVPVKLAERVADVYERLPAAPSDPAVRTAYDSFIADTARQWQAATAAGYKMEPWRQEGQPYKNSAEMRADVRDNKHLWFFPTHNGFGTGDGVPGRHPLLEPAGFSVGGVDLVHNDVFRAVHDLATHAQEGYEFGPRGEWNAALAHASLYPPEALPAMLAETAGQTSWVNFGRQVRGRDIPPQERPYAEQKAVVLPPELVRRIMATGKQERLYSPGVQSEASRALEEVLSKAEIERTRFIDQNYSRFGDRSRWPLDTQRDDRALTKRVDAARHAYKEARATDARGMPDTSQTPAPQARYTITSVGRDHPLASGGTPGYLVVDQTDTATPEFFPGKVQARERMNRLNALEQANTPPAAPPRVAYDRALEQERARAIMAEAIAAGDGQSPAVRYVHRINEVTRQHGADSGQWPEPVRAEIEQLRAAALAASAERQRALQQAAPPATSPVADLRTRRSEAWASYDNFRRGLIDQYGDNRNWPQGSTGRLRELRGEYENLTQQLNAQNSPGGFAEAESAAVPESPPPTPTPPAAPRYEVRKVAAGMNDPAWSQRPVDAWFIHEAGQEGPISGPILREETANARAKWMNESKARTRPAPAPAAIRRPPRADAPSPRATTSLWHWDEKGQGHLIDPEQHIHIDGPKLRLAEFWHELGKDEELAKYPLSDATDPDEIARDLSGGGERMSGEENYSGNNSSELDFGRERDGDVVDDPDYITERAKEYREEIFKELEDDARKDAEAEVRREDKDGPRRFFDGEGRPRRARGRAEEFQQAVEERFEKLKEERDLETKADDRAQEQAETEYNDDPPMEWSDGEHSYGIRYDGQGGEYHVTSPRGRNVGNGHSSFDYAVEAATEHARNYGLLDTDADKIEFTTPRGGTLTIEDAESNPRIYAGNNSSGKTGGGSQLYKAAFLWAHNNGRTISSSGLTAINTKRRTSNMLSMAVQLGDTDFSTPAREQGLNWKRGDHWHNIEELAKKEAEFVLAEVPNIARLQFDFATGKFKDSEGTTLSPDAVDRLLEQWITAGRASGRSAFATGLATAKRAILTRSALSALERPALEGAPGAFATGRAGDRVSKKEALGSAVLYSPGGKKAEGGSQKPEGKPPGNARLYTYGGKTATGFKAAEKNKETFTGEHDAQPRFEIDDSQGRVLHRDSAGWQNLWGGETVRLSQLVQHDELFKNYPELKKLKVNSEKLGYGNALAQYDPITDMITLGPQFVNRYVAQGGEADRGELRKLLLHEVQHKLQAVENFASGNNIDGAGKANANSINQAIKIAEEMDKARKAGASAADLAKQRAEINSHLRWVNMTYSPKAIAFLREKFTPAKGELVQSARQLIGDEKWEAFARRRYRAAAGEIESRDVEARADFTPAQRRATPPYSSEVNKMVDRADEPKAARERRRKVSK